MRFMVMVKANQDTEAGVMPSTELLTEMGRFNEALTKAGLMLSGEGLQPTSKGARIRFHGTERTVMDGPFTESKDLIAGFWLIQAPSKQAVVDWFKRCPNPTGEVGELEIRQIYEFEDFGDALPAEVKEQEAKRRAQGS